MNSTWLIRIALAVTANGVLIAVAALIFDEFAMTFGGWIVATAVMSAFTIGLTGIATKVAAQYASQATWVAGLALVFLALFIADSLFDEVYLEGGLTWILPTLIIWLGTLLYDRVDDRLADEVGQALGR
ncbi:MAG TPA: hypothetical protein VNZ66_04105 [Aeromicrobium sp.]|nr:hypothetical protein [Aeromicrobium sp.]